jgi:hypothetical protein
MVKVSEENLLGYDNMEGRKATLDLNRRLRLARWRPDSLFPFQVVFRSLTAGGYLDKLLLDGFLFSNPEYSETHSQGGNSPMVKKLLPWAKRQE